MGEARNNPRSAQYAGPLPEFAIQPVLGHRLVPSAAWLAANKEALERKEQVPLAPEDCILEIVAYAGMAYPSRLVDPPNWPQAGADVDVIARRPFKEFKADIDASIAKREGRETNGVPTGQAAG